MPDLVAPDELDGMTAEMATVFIRHRVLAVMLYPEQTESAARERHNVQLQINMAWLREQPNLDMHIWSERLIEPFYSLDLADAKGAPAYENDFVHRMKLWWPIGNSIIQLMPAKLHHDAELRGGASMSKLLREAAHAIRKDETGLFKHWTKAKPVAHILAGLVRVHNSKQKPKGSILGELADLIHILTFARFVQSFLVEWEVSDGAGINADAFSLPFDKASLWTIPDSGWSPEREIAIEPLHPGFLARMQARTVL